MRKNKVRVDIGVNSAFMTRRYEESASWVHIVRDLGFQYMSFDSDALDPFFSGPRAYVLDKAGEIGALAKSADLTITDYFTGYASYRFMGFSHRDPEQRERMREWFEGAVDIAAAMGAWGAGGRCDAYSVEVLSDPAEAARRGAQTVAIFRRLAEYAHNAGLRSIYNEIMYVPSLVPHTFQEADAFFRAANAGRRAAAPVRPVVDTGHACGQHYGLAGDELRYEKWIERWGAACDVLHIQQTRRTSSDHAPFAPHIAGDVTIEAILRALEYSLDHAEEAPWSAYLTVPERIILVLEALPGTAQSEAQLLSDLRQSVRYLRAAIPEGGIML